MKVLVTGAGGFVGEYLVRLLLDHGHELQAMGIGNGAFLEELGIPAHEVDICNAGAVQVCMSAVCPDAVIHLAAISNVPMSWQHPGRTIDVNIRGTVNVLQALAEVNPSGRFLNIGSSDEYGLTAKSGAPLSEDMPCLPQNPYSISKYCAEQMALQIGKQRGVKVIQTRSFNHFGPGQAKGFVTSDFASQIAAMERGDKPPVLHVGDLSACRDFTFVADVVAAYAALIEKDVPGGVYNICSGRARSMEDILRELVSLSSLSISIEQDPERMRLSEVPYFIGNAEKLKAATGWKPKYSFSQGMGEVLDYWRRKAAAV